MKEDDIKKAGLIAAVICRVVDYHATVSTVINAPKGASAAATRAVIVDAERSVAVALENMFAVGALK